MRITVPLTLIATVLIAIRINAEDTRPPSQNENELEAALAGLGVDGQVPTSGGMDDYIQATIKDALDKQEQNRQREMDDDFIPQPDSPVTASTYADDDDEDAEETDYFKLKKMKEFYPRKGDVQRLNAETFDEAVFAGEQEFTIIVFYAKFCKQCKYHAPSLRAAGWRYKNDPKVKVFAVNQEGNYELSARFDLEPAHETVLFAHKNPQTDGDLKEYEGEVSFASLLQFIGSRGKDMIKIKKYVPTLYKDYGPGKWVNQKLTWDTFNDTVFDPTKNVLIQFYAGWSEFCQIDSRNYTVLAARMRVEHSDVVIAAIDVDVHSDLADRFDITGLPAYWFANKTVTKDTQLLKYTGDHGGAIVIEEAFPFILSQGQTIPDGMKYDKPIHPEPWETIKAKLDKEKEKNNELNEKQKKKQDDAAVVMRAKLEAKKKAMQDKKKKKEEKKDEL